MHISLLLTLLLSYPPYLSSAKVAARLTPDPKSRIWVRGTPLPDTSPDSTFLALSFMESTLLPAKTLKPAAVNNKQPLPAGLKWLKGMKYPDVPVEFNKATVKYLRWFKFNRTGRNVIRAWIERSGRYRAMILEALKRHRLPSALMYVALIESGYVKTTRSWAGALGLWQFMPSGTKVYGLEKSYWVDQRINPELSTEAAMLYFTDLYYRFGNWSVSMGAYNCGYGRMLQSMRRYSSNSYYKLSSFENALPRETRLYVPKMTAVAIADLNRDIFDLKKLSMAKPYAFETIYVPGGYSLKHVAKVVGVSFKELWNLNREYIRKRLPPGAARWPVRLPHGHREKALKRISRLSSKWFKYTVYEVQLGDSLTSIAQMYGMSSRALRKLNGFVSSTELRQGMRIVVPRRTPKPLPGVEKAAKPIVTIPAEIVPPKGTKRYLYKTMRGDTLGDIARALRLPVSKLLEWNAIFGDVKITYGMYLQLFLPASETPHRALLRPDQVVLITADSEKFFAHYLKKDNRVRIVITARRTDTLKKLGKRFGCSARFIRSLNRLESSKLKQGQRLIIYALRKKLSKKMIARYQDAVIQKKRPLALPVKPKKSQPNPVRKPPGKTVKPSKHTRVNHTSSAPSTTGSHTGDLTSPYRGDISASHGITWKGTINTTTPKGSRKK